MPTVLHPRAVDGVTGHPPSAVTVRGETFDVDENARVTLPDESHVEALADTYDLAPEQLAPEFEGSETCEVVKNDGEVCGRELPCPYHSED
jgi:hypothetical protein